MLKTAPGQAACRLHAAVLPFARHAPTPHPLEMLADRAAHQLAGCTLTLIAGCFAPAILMVENCAADAGPQATATWLVTIASPTTMRLEAMVDDARLDLLAEGPPDWIITQLDTVNRLVILNRCAATCATRSTPILVRS